MRIATIIVSVLMALTAAGSGAAKLAGVDGALSAVASVGFPLELVWVLALLELAGALGLLLGLVWRPLGIAAATGLTLYFLLALGGHLLAGDPGFAPALALTLLAATALVLRLRSRSGRPLPFAGRTTATA